MQDTATKTNIRAAINSFTKGSLTENGLKLFQSLGYNTERRAHLSKPTFSEFKDNYIDLNSKFSEVKASVQDWKYVDLLFQLSSEEMQKQEPLFKPTLDRNEPSSYLFFVLELQNKQYSRSQLSQITREINKLFPMHVFVIFKYGELLSLSLIDRRVNKKVVDKDVLEKVTHVYNVSIAKPHSAHIHILYTFSFSAISIESRKKGIENFNDLQNGWRRVISTDVLNRQFYLDYSKLSISLINSIYPKQVKNKLIAHQGILNLLNRLMFIYFVQKKEWIMKDENFLFHFWNDYLVSKKQNVFHEEWLNSVFFSAFNGVAFKDPKAIKALPEPYKSEIINFPYLNGGLFAFNDEYDSFVLSDKSFEDIFKFFESYIFTISEDTPYDVNLEINPELLGKMYEGMINATDLDDVDAEHGIIYTERPEINFMTRRSFVEVLDKKFSSSLSREFLYHFVFDEPEQKKEVLKRYKINTKNLRNTITTITACDPSCGSGSMLLGVIQLQMELLRVIDEYDGKTQTPQDDFNIKKQLISECIYGVDIKEWAVRIAELRLWLYMISEADFSKEELTKHPLLPNLDFKLRKGNSLLQKIGSLDFTLEELLKGRNKSAGAARKLNEFIKRKKEFIINQSESKTSYKKLKEEEFQVFNLFIEELIIECDIKLKNLGKRGKQESMFDEPKQVEIDLNSEEKENLINEISQLKKLKVTIHKDKKLPFSYDIDFMEVFLTKEDPGFDLIIGNPPYVRQEQILPPEDGEYLEYLLLSENKEEKAKVSKDYKDELNAKVFKTFPFLSSTLKTQVNGKNKSIPVYGNKVPGRSDLYCYFQVLCPAYLNSKGTFCFIISNSWLDVDFGSFVQHFLLKHSKVYAIYDCNVRSFDASVNTVIYIHSALQNIPEQIGNAKNRYKLAQPIDNVVQFIMNKIDYTQALYAPLLIEQEHCRKNTFNELYRLIALNQKELYATGYDEDELQYAGDKWGGKYLRAPEIYYTILNKGGEKLTKLKEIADVKFGVKTGANEFFYIDKEKQNNLGIEKKYLKKVIKSPRDFNSILISSKEMTAVAFNCSESKNSLKGTNALKYINWGEKSVIEDGVEVRAFNLRPSCSRSPWYSFEEIEGNTFWGKELRERLAVFCSDEICVADCRLYVATLSKKQQAILNSTLSIFVDETLGRQLGGGGGPRSVMVYEIKNLTVLNENAVRSNKLETVFSKLANREILPFIDELGFDKDKPIREQLPNPLADRKELDTIVFDELGLTSEERNEVYWSVAELIKQRLDKASSR